MLNACKKNIYLNTPSHSKSDLNKNNDNLLYLDCGFENYLQDSNENKSCKELIAVLLSLTSDESSLSENSRQTLDKIHEKIELLFTDKACHILESNGVSPEKCQIIAAALELGKRFNTLNTMSITTPESTLSYFTDIMSSSRENFKALYLDCKKRVIKSDLISVGSLTSSIVHPREVFLPAITNAADSLIIAHNHPSGDPVASVSDIAVTKCLAKAGEILCIPLVDHIILGKGSFVSLRRQGVI